MRTFWGVTDENLFEFLRRQESLDGVSFWQPGATLTDRTSTIWLTAAPLAAGLTIFLAQLTYPWVLSRPV